MAAKPERRFKVVADNRKARFNYEIGETYEAGIALTGTEVKSLRQGKATIAESYADTRGGELWLINANIPEYLQGGRYNQPPKRPRKLLLHKRELNKFYSAVLGAELVQRPAGWAYRFGDKQLNVHGPGVQPAEVARLPVQPGNSDLCFEWMGPVDGAISHLKAHGVAVERGPMQRF